MQRLQIILLLILTSSLLFAQENEWTPINNGLENLQVYTIVDNPEDPDILYAGAEDGLYRSTNHGERWQSLRGGFPVRAVWVSPDGRTILIAHSDGGRSAGIWISRNGGDDFGEFPLVWFLWPTAIAVDPENLQHIFCGSIAQGFHYSLNGGEEWQEGGLRNNRINHISVKNSEDGTYLFASTESGLYRSELADDFRWDGIGPHRLPACQTAFSFEDDQGVFVGTGDESDSDGLYYSDNLGDDWDWPPLIWAFYVQAVETMPELVVMASTEIGVMRSTDGGENWTEMNEELDDFDISDLLVQVDGDETRFYCSTNGSGIFVYIIPGEEDQPPSPFALLEPENDVTVRTLIVTFTWEASEDPDPEDEVTYDWLIQYDECVETIEDLDTTELVLNLDSMEVDGEAFWQVTAVSGDLSTRCDMPFTFFYEPTSVDGDDNVSVTDFHLYPAYPNPFNASTTFSFDLPFNGWVKLAIYDLNGRKVADLADDNFRAGRHSLLWDAENMVSGIYLARLEAQGEVRMVKLMLIR